MPFAIRGSVEGGKVYFAATGLTVAEESSREAGRRIRDIFVCSLRGIRMEVKLG